MIFFANQSLLIHLIFSIALYSRMTHFSKSSPGSQEGLQCNALLLYILPSCSRLLLTIYFPSVLRRRAFSIISSLCYLTIRVSDLLAFRYTSHQLVVLNCCTHCLLLPPLPTSPLLPPRLLLICVYF